MNTLITDPVLAQELIRRRQQTGADRYDEVWDGVYVRAPVANTEHQWLGGQLCHVLILALGEGSGAKVFPGINVSDREGDWSSNDRCPDVAVVLPGNPAKDCDTHLCGGPDFLVEIVSPHDRSREKLDFYGRIGVRELLIIDRDPWVLELYCRRNEHLQRVGISIESAPATLTSEVLPLSFPLLPTQAVVPGSRSPRQWPANHRLDGPFRISHVNFPASNASAAICARCRNSC